MHNIEVTTWMVGESTHHLFLNLVKPRDRDSADRNGRTLSFLLHTTTQKCPTGQPAEQGSRSDQERRKQWKLQRGRKYPVPPASKKEKEKEDPKVEKNRTGPRPVHFKKKWSIAKEESLILLPLQSVVVPGHRHGLQILRKFKPSQPCCGLRAKHSRCGPGSSSP